MKQKEDLTGAIIDVAGSAKMCFTPGWYCGDKWGFEVTHENWLVKENLRGHNGFSAGGVIDFKDIERLYKLAKQYQSKNKRMPIGRLLK